MVSSLGPRQCVCTATNALDLYFHPFSENVNL